MICSHHNIRGERIKEFNVAPKYFKSFKNSQFTYREQVIPIVCEGWEKYGKVEILYLQSNFGNLYVTDFTYSLL